MARILLSPVKKSPGLNQERNLHRSSTIYKPKQLKIVLNKHVGGFGCDRQQEVDIIMDYRLAFWQRF